MRLPPIRLTIRQVMILVALIGLVLGIIGEARVASRAAKYRRKVAYCERMARRCREIVAMAPEIRAKEADYEMDDVYLCEPDWTAKMIGYFDGLKVKYRRAAEHPREPVAPDPPAPDG